MKIKNRLRRLIYFLAALIICAGSVAALYYGSIPEKYSLKTGDASPYDINAIRSVEDVQATVQKANQAASEVQDVMLVNPSINTKNMERINTFFSLAATIRSEMKAETNPLSAANAAAKLRTQVKDQIKKEIKLEDCTKTVTMEQALFDSLDGHCVTIAQLILSSAVSQDLLTIQIQNKITELSGTIEYYGKDITIASDILTLFLEPNIEYDKEATKAAKDLAYQTVINNPVMILKGTRIVNYGDIITPDTYRLLSEMDLIDTNEFDFGYLGGIILLLLLIIGITALYAAKYEKGNINTMGDKISILIAMLIPLFLSLILVKFSVVASPIYIAAVLITAYFGFRSSLVMTTLLSFAILPITGFNVKFLIVALSGCIIASLFTIGISKRDNYAMIIISTSLTCFTASVAYDVLIKTELRETFFDAAYSTASGAASVIIALGLMPLFEMIFNSVSPLRLIELAQPGNPLLQKLFIEAPGTSQHSVMVGNLAETGAQAIGANSMIARVGAYYHDIGKLENPEMFTENQEGVNPHDSMPPEESAAIILAHPEAGLRIAKKYRLPIPICRLIYEHHGTSRQMYFLRKAQEIAEKNNLPYPDPQKYMYHCPKPSCKESAILMMADTVEAAMKSTGITNVEEGEKLIRKLIKHKIEEDQLIDSDLSFKEIEQIIQAFLQVYSGHFHVRVRYPDEDSNKK